MQVEVRALLVIGALRRLRELVGSDRARDLFFAPVDEERPTPTTVRAEARREEMARLIHDEGVNLVDELAERLGVSVTQVARDAEILGLPTTTRRRLIQRDAAERQEWLARTVRKRWGSTVPSAAEVADILGLPPDRTRKDLRALGIASLRRRRDAA